MEADSACAIRWDLIDIVKEMKNLSILVAESLVNEGVSHSSLFIVQIVLSLLRGVWVFLFLFFG